MSPAILVSEAPWAGYVSGLHLGLDLITVYWQYGQNKSNDSSERKWTVKIIAYSDVEPTYFENPQVKGVAGRVVIGKNDNANNFCMRVFEIASGGNTPRHSHDWEHEVFVHSGEGEVYGEGQWKPLQAGNVIFIPGNKEHQIRNVGKGKLVFVCLVPSGAPEL